VPDEGSATAHQAITGQEQPTELVIGHAGHSAEAVGTHAPSRRGRVIVGVWNSFTFRDADPVVHAAIGSEGPIVQGDWRGGSLSAAGSQAGLNRAVFAHNLEVAGSSPTPATKMAGQRSFPDPGGLLVAVC
jgi:hypothetical protein